MSAKFVGQNAVKAKLKPGAGGGTKTARGVQDAISYTNAIRKATGNERVTEDQDPAAKLLLESDTFSEGTNDPSKLAKQRINDETYTKLAKEMGKTVKAATQNQEKAVLAESSKAFLLLLRDKAGEFMPKYLADKKQVQKQAIEKQNYMEQVANTLEDPKNLPQVFKDIVASNIDEAKKEAKKKDDKQKLAQVEKVEEEVAELLDMDLDASKQYISSEQLLDHISKMDKKSIPDSVKPLIPSIKDKSYAYMQAVKRYLGLTKEHENHFLKINGIDRVTDKELYRNLMVRTGSKVADRNGVSNGIGGVFDYRDGDIDSSVAGLPFEHNPDEYGLTQASFPILRLLRSSLAPAQHRTYTGVAVDEKNPVPAYVNVA